MNRNLRLSLIGQLVEQDAEHLPPRLRDLETRGDAAYYASLGIDAEAPGFGNAIVEEVVEDLLGIDLDGALRDELTRCVLSRDNAGFLLAMPSWDGESDAFDVASLAGIEVAQALRELVIVHAEDLSLSPLAALPALERLDVAVPCSDVRALTACRVLRTCSLVSPSAWEREDLSALGALLDAGVSVRVDGAPIDRAWLAERGAAAPAATATRARTTGPDPLGWRAAAGAGGLEVLATARGSLAPGGKISLMQAGGAGFVVNDKCLEVWDPSAAEPAVYAKGKSIVSGAEVVRGGDGVVGWSDKKVAAWTRGKRGGYKPLTVKAAHSRRVSGVFGVVGADSAVSVGGGQAIRWSTASGQVEASWEVPSSEGIVVGRQLVLSEHMGTRADLVVFDVMDGREVARLALPEGFFVGCLAALPENRVALGRGNRLVVVDLQASEIIRVIETIGPDVARIDAAIDRPVVAASTPRAGKKRYELWNYETGALVSHFAADALAGEGALAPVIVTETGERGGPRVEQLRLAPRDGLVLGCHPGSITLHALDGALLDTLSFDLDIDVANKVRGHCHIDELNRAFVLFEGAAIGARPKAGVTAGGFLQLGSR